MLIGNFSGQLRVFWPAGKNLNGTGNRLLDAVLHREKALVWTKHC